MREVVFKGKRIDNSEWVEGWYIHTKRHHCIITGCIDDGYVVYGHYASDVAMYVVDPATVGQYTGLKDKNGKRIFEGDIVTRILFDMLYQYEVVYQPGYASFDGIRKGGFISFGNDGDCFEVIGNIHDNPELMEVR